MRSSPSAITLRLPATSANLGPAFDAAALALDLYLTIEASAASRFSICAAGRDVSLCKSMRNNLIFDTYREVLGSRNRKTYPLSLKIDNQIPIGRGCGSSAAARLAGIMLAVHFGQLELSGEEILREAMVREGHPDNAAACWLGGIAIARGSQDRGPVPDRMEGIAGAYGQQAENALCTARIIPKIRWPLILVVPPDRYSTEEARRILPEQYSQGDVVTNIQNALLLITALSTGDSHLLRNALNDRLHQPYRAAVCPLLPCLQSLAGQGCVTGAVLSGAGPSVLVFPNAKTSAADSRAVISECLRKACLSAELLYTRISSTGATATVL